MSLFLGHVSGTPVLHLTSSTTGYNTINTLNNLSNTSFHSNNSYVTVDLVEELAGYHITIPIQNGTEYHTRWDISATTEAYLQDGSTLIFAVGMNQYGDIRVVGITPGFDSLEFAIPGIRYDSSNFYIQSYSGMTHQYLADTYVAPTTTGYMHVYKLNITPVNTGTGISITNSEFRIGDFYPTSHTYLDLGNSNGIDRSYTADKLGVFQLLNFTRTQQTLQGIKLEKDKVTASYTSVDIPLFGGGLQPTTKLIGVNTYNNVVTMTLTPTFPSSRFLVSITRRSAYPGERYQLTIHPDFDNFSVTALAPGSLAVGYVASTKTLQCTYSADVPADIVTIYEFA